MATGPTTFIDSHEGTSLSSNTLRPRTHTWQDLRNAVKETRRVQSSLVFKVPTEFVFKKLVTADGIRRRLYFLGVPFGGRENTLMYVDIPGDVDTLGCVNLTKWQPLLVSYQGMTSKGGFSKIEQLLRERKRLGGFGITSYDIDVESGRFLFSAGCSLFYCTDSCFSLQPIFPKEVHSSVGGIRMDPKLCPTNTDLIAYVCNNDLWVSNVATGDERRLTFTHKGLDRISDDPKSAAVASYIIQEEFDRYTGYWWQPNIYDATEPDKKTYRILYEEVDESDVEILHIVSSTYGDSGVDDYRYPRAGTKNASVILKMVEFSVNADGSIINVQEFKLVESLCQLFPPMEYIVRLNWTPDGKSIWAQLLSRNQQLTMLVLIPVHCFVPVHENEVVVDSEKLPIQVLYEEYSEIWINVHDCTQFFPQTKEEEVSFIWASEAHGTRQLFLVTSALRSTGEVPGNLKPVILNHCQLTFGDGEVVGRRVWLDPGHQLLYYMAHHHTPLEEHLYVTCYSSPGSPLRLTELGSSHTVYMSEDCDYFVTIYSNLSNTPAATVYQLKERIMGMSPVTVGPLLQSTALGISYIPPELVSYKNSAGDEVFGLVYKPHNFEPGRKYPTVLFVYGGPQVQLVTNSYKGIKLLRLHTLASLGYVVLVIDTRGSSHRGLKFESILKNKMGTVEIAEQVEGLHWIAAKMDFIDLKRVAIHGWSYGGYLSLMGLARRPDVFKVAIAGAPVTCWKQYDTGYTERYMDTPQNNPQGYQQGSVLKLVKNFPNEENRLLIIHGLIDENVHFHHTSLLIKELIKACKPYMLQVYPKERHGIRQPEAQEHYETTILSWLMQHL
ncbi:dipeptidyl peptidase 9-like [Anneissia japonica]|uniref:dipeptidyl peptidase 9-like n=1 Tax=Anneissia japonica TaxID=1529436 RepID=UPI0014257DB4|nr:dipeptidyl peptidase 9-like [Anneissia japonica]XP_033105731.1 dipeptidyl peptidase 9-like [Anneissia japonica]XP_033105732.1 dipeptidyl peptidase 9-like [Anneissia japonica]XP_033105733.1 dipeptidyl peptidase 9-like [Anneissia japonica]